MQTSRQATSCSLLGMRVFSQNLSRQSGNIPVLGKLLTMNARSMLRGSSVTRKTITGAIQFFVILEKLESARDTRTKKICRKFIQPRKFSCRPSGHILLIFGVQHVWYVSNSIMIISHEETDVLAFSHVQVWDLV